ncbi:hypothetical protein KAH94_03070 [bacterium]|nr:hypothetical protein [bacterium]
MFNFIRKKKKEFIKKTKKEFLQAEQFISSNNFIDDMNCPDRLKDVPHLEEKILLLFKLENKKKIHNLKMNMIKTVRKRALKLKKYNTLRTHSKKIITKYFGRNAKPGLLIKIFAIKDTYDYSLNKSKKDKNLISNNSALRFFYSNNEKLFNSLPTNLQKSLTFDLKGIIGFQKLGKYPKTPQDKIATCYHLLKMFPNQKNQWEKIISSQTTYIKQENLINKQKKQFFTDMIIVCKKDPY